MATAKRRNFLYRSTWPSVLLVVALLGVALGWVYRAPVAGYSQAGAAYGARMTCSCRYVAGRPMGDCKKDFEPGMWAVFVSEDEDEKSVTARVPLIASETARYREGYGCVLDSWAG